MAIKEMAGGGCVEGGDVVLVGEMRVTGRERRGERGKQMGVCVG